MPDLPVKGCVMPHTSSTEHTLGPLVGFGSDFHADCSCSVRLTGESHEALRAAHQIHVAAVVLRPGVARARAALASSVARKEQSA